MSAAVFYPDRERRVKELGRARKAGLVAIYRLETGRVMPRETLLRWRKDELRTAILELEFPPIPPAGTPVTVRQDCTLPWLRGETGRVTGSTVGGMVRVLLDNRGHQRKLPLLLAPFELEVSR